MANIRSTGHYTISQYDQQSHSFSSPSALGLYITVEEVFDAHHRIVSQKGEAKGRFTFSAADSGEHRLCFSPTNWQALGSYTLGGEEMGGLRVELDMAIGETSAIESTDKSKMEDLVSRIRDLNGRLADVRREQVFQRVRRGIESSTRSKDTVLINIHRNERPSSAINRNPQTPKLSDIPLFNSSY